MHVNVNNPRRETLRKQTGILAGSTLIMLLMVGDKSFAVNYANDIPSNCVRTAHLPIDNAIYRAHANTPQCSESLNQLQLQQTASLFPDVVEGFNGNAIDSRRVNGNVIIERVYTKEEQQLEVHFGVGSFLANVAKLVSEKMEAGTTKTRVDSYTVVGRLIGEEMYFFIMFGDDTTLTFSTESVATEDMMDFIREFPVEEVKKSIE